MTPGEAARQLKRNWSRFVDSFRRQGHDCEYAWCLGWHRNGWPHLHIIQRGNYIPQRLLSKYMLKKINSPNVDIRAVGNSHQAIVHACRYLMDQDRNANGADRGQRRIYTSAHYEPETNARRSAMPDPDWKWEYSKDSVLVTVAKAVSRGGFTDITITPDGCVLLKNPTNKRYLEQFGIVAEPTKGRAVKPPRDAVTSDPPQLRLLPPDTCID